MKVTFHSRTIQPCRFLPNYMTLLILARSKEFKKHKKQVSSTAWNAMKLIMMLISNRPKLERRSMTTFITRFEPLIFFLSISCVTCPWWWWWRQKRFWRCTKRQIFIEWPFNCHDCAWILLPHCWNSGRH